MTEQTAQVIPDLDRLTPLIAARLHGVTFEIDGQEWWVEPAEDARMLRLFRPEAEEDDVVTVGLITALVVPGTVSSRPSDDDLRYVLAASEEYRRRKRQKDPDRLSDDEWDIGIEDTIKWVLGEDGCPVIFLGVRDGRMPAAGFEWLADGTWTPRDAGAAS